MTPAFTTLDFFYDKDVLEYKHYIFTSSVLIFLQTFQQSSLQQKSKKKNKGKKLNLFSCIGRKEIANFNVYGIAVSEELELVSSNPVFSSVDHVEKVLVQY